jgi:hypothetical protein
MLILTFGACWCGAAELPKEVQVLHDDFEASLKKVEKQGQDALAAISDTYLQRLRELARLQQARGHFRGLVAMRDEIARFAKARTLPDRPVEEPVELRDAQATFQARLQQTQYSNEFSIVKLAEHYVQALAIASEDLTKGSSTTDVQTVESECDRVVALPRLRQALEATKIRPASVLPKTPSNLVASTTSSDARIRRPLDIFRPSNEPLAATINYDGRVQLSEDATQVRQRKSAGAGSSYRSQDGPIGYTLRVTLSCRSGEIPSGSKLCIEYYSRSLPEHNLRREAVEWVALPRLDRSKSYVIESKGIKLNRSESVSVQQYAGVSVSNFGAEFYGVILHLVDPDGRVLWQRFSPQALERELAATPPEK